MKVLTIFVCLASFALAETPAEISIRKAQEQIGATPEHAPYYNSLAMAYARRAREISDVGYYQKAEETLDRAAALSPDDFETRRTRVWLMLGRHEFTKALDAAAKLNKEAPDDVTIYGYLADANTELGNYSAAVDAVQWMLKLRTGNIPGLTRAAYLRELHGDVEGAIELMRRAYDATAFQQAEDRAWILTQIAHLQLQAGDAAQAESSALAALEAFPDYHYALGMLAQIRGAQHRAEEALALLQKRYDAAPHAENLFSLAQALSRAGRGADAQAAFAEFESAALAESGSTDNANHELILYYTDVARQPGKALAIAEAELARRQDIHTLDAYAWALAASGDLTGARTQIERALATGSKDPELHQHAEAIAQRLL
jgi:tetratricopeptide (TPR) repeat protein